MLTPVRYEVQDAEPQEDGQPGQYVFEVISTNSSASQVLFQKALLIQLEKYDPAS